jgi:hypothetical protein
MGRARLIIFVLLFLPVCGAAQDKWCGKPRCGKPFIGSLPADDPTWKAPKGLALADLNAKFESELEDKEWTDVLKEVHKLLSDDKNVPDEAKEILLDRLALAIVDFSDDCLDARWNGPDKFKPRKESNGWSLFGASSKKLTVTKGEMTETQAAYVLAYVHYLHRTLSRAGITCTDKAVAALRETVKRWDAFHKYGYSQYPWEVWINGWCRSAADLEPPRAQAIVLHPAVIIEADASSATDVRIRNPGVMLETLGVVFYTNKRHFYFGASQALIFSDDQPPGIGFNVHLGRLVSAGYIWRSEDDKGRNALILSVDLAKLLLGKPDNDKGAVDNLRKLGELF